jgi:hypothetical protein
MRNKQAYMTLSSADVRTSLHRWLLPFEMLYRPRVAFRTALETPGWIPAFVVNVAAAVIAGVLVTPYAEALFLSSMPPDASVNAASQFHYVLVGQVLLPVVAIPLQWLVFSALIFMVVVALDWEWPEFRRVFSMVAYSHFVLEIKELANALLVVSSGGSRINSLADLDAIPGLGAVVRGADNAALARALDGIDPFVVWYVAVLGVGISVLTGRPWGKTVWAASFLWLFILLGNIALASLK